MTHVLVLGAGASRPAGYPLTRDLLPEMARDAAQTSFAQYKHALSEWHNFLTRLPSELGILAYSSNPEIILSLADLFDAAAEHEDRDRTEQAIELLRATGISTAADLKLYFESPEREFLSKARLGRSRLLHALESYFLFKHLEDHHRPPETRAYLADLLAPLSWGDAVLTFNWDSLAERVLLEQGRWFPADGFGFPRTLVRDHQLGRREAIASNLYGPSQVLVLKLHGSFGWRQSDNSLFLDGPEYLGAFTFTLGGSLAFLRDSAEPELYTPTDPLVAYPSFLKPLAHPTLEGLWRIAAAVLDGADVVEVVGYSLPPSDSAARALFLGLSLRSRSRAVRVIVRDPSQRSLDHWGAFLGPHAEYRQEQLVPRGSA